MQAQLITEEFMISGGDSGVLLYVRNKRPEGLPRFIPDNIVLFVHGATYPADTSFDLTLDGTHSIIMEKNRMQLFREVQLFLDEPAPGKPGN